MVLRRERVGSLSPTVQAKRSIRECLMLKHRMRDAYSHRCSFPREQEPGRSVSSGRKAGVLPNVVTMIVFFFSLLVLVRSFVVLSITLFQYERSHVMEALRSGVLWATPQARTAAMTFVHAITAALAFAIPPLQPHITGQPHYLLGVIYIGLLTMAMFTAFVLCFDREDAPWSLATIAASSWCCMAMGMLRLVQQQYVEHSRHKHGTASLQHACVKL